MYYIMAGDDLTVAADQDRVREPEAPDAVRDLTDLLLRMTPGITGVGPQGGDQPHFDLRGELHSDALQAIVRLAQTMAWKK